MNGIEDKQNSRPSQEEMEDAVRVFLRWAGDDPEREGLSETPSRVANAYREFFAGYEVNPEEVLAKSFDTGSEYDEIVLLRDIRVESYCEHHLVPIIGRAHVAYYPGPRVVGISKLARVVDAFSKRLQIQERLTAEIADTLNKALRPRGVAVIIESGHQCMSTRGVHKVGSTMVTSKMLGIFRDNLSTRHELLSLIGMSQPQVSALI